LDEELVVVNTPWANEFNDLTEFPRDEINHWIVTFVNDNEYHLSSVDHLRSLFKEIEEDIFSLRVKQDIIVPPMKEYNNEWIKKSLQQIIDPK